jgi:hypothetical protein
VPKDPPPPPDLSEETKLLLETLRVQLKKLTGSERRAAGLAFGFAVGWLLDLEVQPTDMSDHLFRLIRDREIL